MMILIIHLVNKNQTKIQITTKIQNLNIFTVKLNSEQC